MPIDSSVSIARLMSSGSGTSFRFNPPLCVAPERHVSNLDVELVHRWSELEPAEQRVRRSGRSPASGITLTRRRAAPRHADVGSDEATGAASGTVSFLVGAALDDEHQPWRAGGRRPRCRRRSRTVVPELRGACASAATVTQLRGNGTPGNAGCRGPVGQPGHSEGRRSMTIRVSGAVGLFERGQTGSGSRTDLDRRRTEQAHHAEIPGRV